MVGKSKISYENLETSPDGAVQKKNTSNIPLNHGE